MTKILKKNSIIQIYLIKENVVVVKVLMMRIILIMNLMIIGMKNLSMIFR